MNGYKRYTEEEVIALTHQAVQYLHGQSPGLSEEALSDAFVWIGACSWQWSLSKSQYHRLLQPDHYVLPAQVRDEEYHLLACYPPLWILYGRYYANPAPEGQPEYFAEYRTTFVWKQDSHGLRLLHAHTSNSLDFPAAVRRQESFGACPRRYEFRDRDSHYHFLTASELIYLESFRQNCSIVTLKGHFEIRESISRLEASLPRQFLRIHKSYLVNVNFIDSISRYRAHLKTGAELPIGKSRYMAVRESLQNN